jgi:selenocysteine-specific elongation factor
VTDDMRVVVTAGHVDHGKSTLLKALTGMEPDRYAEEQRRGMTLDLGFVWCELPSGRGVAFVDVPGHARLVRTMLAGAGTGDRCLFVVAADEGWMPQSEEHLRILQLVGTRAGVVALTKVGSLDAEMIALAREELAESVAGTFLESAAVVEVDAIAGIGLDAVTGALDELLDGAEPSPDSGRPRLWIDRAFSMKGAGTVVTGTLTGGVLTSGDELDVLDRRGQSHPVRVRGLQTQKAPRSIVGPGQRVAVNLTGLDAHALRRGAVLVHGGQWRPTRRFDVRIEVLAGESVANRGSLLAYVGTAEQPARVRLLEGTDRVEGGNAGRARVWLSSPLPLAPGDRLVLRDAGRSRTVAGCEVLDVQPVVAVSRARPDRSIERVVAEHGWIDAVELEAITGARVVPMIGRWVVSPAARAQARREIESGVDAAGPLGLNLASLDERLRALLPTMEELVVNGTHLRRAGSADPLAEHPWVAQLEAFPFAPPPPDGVPAQEVRELVRRGAVIHEGGCYFAVSALERARQLVVAFLAEHPEGITVSELRELLGTSRRFALPLVAALDQRGVTLRRGDLRTAGRRIDQEIAATTG